jgi:hypothetical protein
MQAQVHVRGGLHTSAAHGRTAKARHWCAPGAFGVQSWRLKRWRLMSRTVQWGLTPRSRRAPTAGHQAPATGTLYIFCARGLASHRRCRLTSNVRPHTGADCGTPSAQNTTQSHDSQGPRDFPYSFTLGCGYIADSPVRSPSFRVRYWIPPSTVRFVTMQSKTR